MIIVYIIISPLNSYLYIHWILDFKYILLLFSENSEFTLDYICVVNCALKSVQSAYILEREEVVESDHAAIGADVEWKVKRKRKARRKMKTTRKRRLAVDKWDVYGSQMEQESIKICLV